MIRDTIFNISLLQSFNKIDALNLPEIPSSVKLRRIIQTLNTYDKNEEIDKRVDILKKNIISSLNTDEVDLSFASIVKCNKLESEYTFNMLELERYCKQINPNNFYSLLPSILATQNKLFNLKKKLLKYWVLLAKDTQKSLLIDLHFHAFFKDDVNYCLDLFQLFKMTLDHELLADVYKETCKILAKIGAHFLSFTEVDKTLEQKYQTKCKKLPDFIIPFVVHAGQLKNF